LCDCSTFHYVFVTLHIMLKIHEYPQDLVTSACQGGTGGLIARSDISTLLELIREMYIF
jgi:hypothetical protein